LVRSNHRYLATHQVGRQRRQSVILPARPAILNRHVLALDIAGFLQALTKRSHHGLVAVERCAVEEADDWQRRLLRLPGKRPRRHAAEERDELAPSKLVELHPLPLD
jgi:hypothetical protein